MDGELVPGNDLYEWIMEPFRKIDEDYAEWLTRGPETVPILNLNKKFIPTYAPLSDIMLVGTN